MAQAKTQKVTVTAIMRRIEFTMGFDDKCWNSNFHKDYEKWDKRQQWTYERGRLLAAINPSIKIKLGNQLNPDAVSLYRQARQNGSFQ